MMTRLSAITACAPAEAWQAVGFNVSRRPFGNPWVGFANGAVLLEPSVANSPQVAATIIVDKLGHGATAASCDGIDVAVGEPLPFGEHPNTAYELDHIVFDTDSLERTSAAVTATLGLPCKRIRETGHVRQAFHRFEDCAGSRGCILEIVERPDLALGGRARVMGWVITLSNLEAYADAHSDEVLAPPRPAVQPGRNIATFRRMAGLGARVAVMSPYVAGSAQTPG